MYLYCITWKLEVNASKTKIAIFRKRSCKDIVNPVFTFNSEVINIEDDFTYLGSGGFKGGLLIEWFRSV
jgi:hypothetical protein